MSNTPPVTIVTVTYNLINSGRTDYFRQCVESVHQQTYKNIEHLVIDGASNDGTIALVDEYAQKGWLTYISEPDTGIYDAMNKGILRAKGKYIAFLNSDDFYHNQDAVKLSVEALEKSGADFSFAPFIFLKNDGRAKIQKPNIYKFWTRMSIAHPTIFMKVASLQKYGLFDTSFKIAADYYLMLQIISCGIKFIDVNQSITTFRGGGASAGSNQATVNEEFLAMYSAIKAKNNLDENTAKKIYTTKYVPRKILSILIKSYPAKIRWRFYYYNFLAGLKNFAKNIFCCRLTKGKRDIRILGMTVLKDKRDCS